MRRDFARPSFLGSCQSNAPRNDAHLSEIFRTGRAVRRICRGPEAAARPLALDDPWSDHRWVVVGPQGNRRPWYKPPSPDHGSVGVGPQPICGRTTVHGSIDDRFPGVRRQILRGRSTPDPSCIDRPSVLRGPGGGGRTADARSSIDRTSIDAGRNSCIRSIVAGRPRGRRTSVTGPVRREGDPRGQVQVTPPPTSARCGCDQCAGDSDCAAGGQCRGPGRCPVQPHPLRCVPAQGPEAPCPPEIPVPSPAIP